MVFSDHTLTLTFLDGLGDLNLLAGPFQKIFSPGAELFGPRKNLEATSSIAPMKTTLSISCSDTFKQGSALQGTLSLSLTSLLTTST